jgi:UDP-N-acetylmuramate--alanine ligase
VHFIGIGGAGMSGLARMLADIGAIVSGSEPTPNATTIELTRRGVPISRNQMGELLNEQVDLVVRTAAVKDNNPELLAAQRYQFRRSSTRAARAGDGGAPRRRRCGYAR